MALARQIKDKHNEDDGIKLNQLKTKLGKFLKETASTITQKTNEAFNQEDNIF